MTRKAIGSIGWLDLTVDDAPALRDFYRAIVGWTPSDCDMGGYADYVMSTPVTNEATAGVCHARGANAGLPAVWLAYLVVANLEASLAAAEARGGRRRSTIRSAGGGRFAVIEDPAGACVALFEEAAG
jgi:predicted enzyme related to lactoylglutathione lyase